jgi:HAD superfamily hydrolase (TIGR01509 family)
MLVIFDCDGVLIDSEVIACRIDAEELARLGFAITAQEVASRFCGTTMQSMFTALEAEQAITIPKGFANHLRARLQSAFEDELRPMAGIRQALGKITARRCVASSSDPQRLAASLRLTGLHDLFQPWIYSASLVPRSKPAPDLFLHVAREMEVVAEDCIVIEDSLAGVTAGRAAGMTVIGFAGGGHCLVGHDQNLRAAGAALVITEMSRLPVAIDDLRNRQACV